MAGVGYEKGVDVAWVKLRSYNMKNMRGSEYWHLATMESKWDEQCCRWGCK
jgi:hypothetical protein